MKSVAKKKYNQILLFEEGSIDESKHKDVLEEHGIYILSYRKMESGNTPELLNVCETGSSVSAIGFDIEPVNYED